MTLLLTVLTLSVLGTADVWAQDVADTPARPYSYSAYQQYRLDNPDATISYSDYAAWRNYTAIDGNQSAPYTDYQNFIARERAAYEAAKAEGNPDPTPPRDGSYRAYQQYKADNPNADMSFSEYAAWRDHAAIEGNEKASFSDYQNFTAQERAAYEAAKAEGKPDPTPPRDGSYRAYQQYKADNPNADMSLSEYAAWRDYAIENDKASMSYADYLSATAEEIDYADGTYNGYREFLNDSDMHGMSYSDYRRILRDGGDVWAFRPRLSGYTIQPRMNHPVRPRAFSSRGGSGDGETLGAVIVNLIKSTDTVPGLLTGFSYLCGIFFGFWAILKLKDHVENPNNTQIWEPIKRFIAGGAFFALPTVLVAAVNTLAPGLNPANYSGFKSGGASELGLDGMLVKLIADIWTPMHQLFFGFCYLAGVILIIIGISRLLKSEQDGPRGPASIGTIMTFLVGGALLSVDKMLGASVTSLFDSSISSSNGVLVYTAGLEEGLPHAHAVIAAIIAFVAIIGWVSFIRGLFILRGVSEGNSQASMMAAVTHILGGALAVNLGGAIMAVQNTLGITDLGVGITFS